MNKKPSTRNLLFKAAVWFQNRPAVMDLLVVVTAVTLILVGGYL